MSTLSELHAAHRQYQLSIEAANPALFTTLEGYNRAVEDVTRARENFLTVQQSVIEQADWHERRAAELREAVKRHSLVA